MWFKGHSGIWTADTEEIHTSIHRVFSGDHLSLTFIITHGVDHLKLEVKAVPNTQASKVIHHHQQSPYPHLLSHLWIIQKPKNPPLPCSPRPVTHTLSQQNLNHFRSQPLLILPWPRYSGSFSPQIPLKWESTCYFFSPQQFAAFPVML